MARLLRNRRETRAGARDARRRMEGLTTGGEALLRSMEIIMPRMPSAENPIETKISEAAGKIECSNTLEMNAQFQPIVSPRP